MFCHKQDYLKITEIQYKFLKIFYNSNESYEELLYVTSVNSSKAVAYIGY